MKNSTPRIHSRLGLAVLALGTLAVFGLPVPGLSKPGNGKGKGQSSDFVPPGHRRAPVEIIVTKAPPPLRVEVVPPRPSAKHVWVAGYWSWESNAYAWVPGVWMAPPEPAAVWVAPRYETRSGVQISISGYWKL